MLDSLNTSLRKQVGEHQVQQAELKAENVGLKAKVASLRKELAASEVANVAAKAEMEVTLTQIKSVAVNVTLHVRAELMEECKAGQHVNWDPDLEIKFWKEKEAALAGHEDVEETVEEPSSPMVESLRPIEPKKKANFSMVKVTPEELAQVEVVP